MKSQEASKAILIEYSRLSKDDALKKSETAITGLTNDEAASRLGTYGPNEPIHKDKLPIVLQFLSKFLNPIIIGLLLIGLFTLFYSEKISAMFIFAMVLISVCIDFIQEYRSGKDIEKLIEMVKITTATIRSGEKREINNKEIVPGDIIVLTAGDIIPADSLIIDSKDFFVNESSLTGESIPSEKTHESNIDDGNTPGNIVFMGTSVVSGEATCIVIRTWKATEFSSIVQHVSSSTETSFDRGIRDFTWLMIKAILILVFVIFAVNAFLKHNVLESLLFSMAVAIGLIPDMLPLVVTVNLAKGARDMVKKQVIVKHLDAIQNIGAMDVLCTDKTGTLTEDHIILQRHTDVLGKENDEVFTYSYINSYFQSGLKNVLDEAILKHEKRFEVTDKKMDEIPFDFNRKIMSIVIETEDKNKAKGKHSRSQKKIYRIISKGAPEALFKRVTHYRVGSLIKRINAKDLKKIIQTYDNLSSDGHRVLAIAYKDVQKKFAYNYDDEKEMTLLGFIAFLDPPKRKSREAIEELKELGVEVKILTGDNELVTRKICKDLDIQVKGYASGDDIDARDDMQLRDLVEKTSVFTRLTPLQKERIVIALKQNNHTVGFMGDGINDAPTLKKADVGITVENGTDIAKETAGIVLLNKDLTVLKEAIIDGRKIFENIIKYIKMGSSSNFGNMLSVSGASLFLPFLPMLPIQIILNNFLYDMSQLTISTDNVDTETIKKPRQWNMNAIKRFMIYVGTISSIFDFVTFGMFYVIFRSAPPLFQTSWFIESLLTQTLVILIIRTDKIPFIESRPSSTLIIMAILISIIGYLVTVTAVGKIFGFMALPIMYLAIILGITLAYLIVVFFLKRSLIKRMDLE